LSWGADLGISRIWNLMSMPDSDHCYPPWLTWILRNGRSSGVSSARSGPTLPLSKPPSARTITRRRLGVSAITTTPSCEAEKPGTRHQPAARPAARGHYICSPFVCADWGRRPARRVGNGGCSDLGRQVERRAGAATSKRSWGSRKRERLYYRSRTRTLRIPTTHAQPICRGKRKPM
jgi:hypothetical protein